MTGTQIDRVFLDRIVEGDPRTLSILEKVKGSPPIHVVEGAEEVIQVARSQEDPVGGGKRMLFLSRHRGRRVGNCPGTSRHICCGYRVLDLTAGCPMDCSYCVLQGYLTNPVITVFTNFSDLIGALEKGLSEARPALFRVGPGELSDSLALDHLTGFCGELVEWFADREDALLELKTKSDRVDHLLGLRHGGRTVVSWSLNPQSITDTEEHGTPSLIQRLQAARKCQEAGYPIGLHFDPMIFECSWEPGYRDLVERIFQFLDPRGVIWISMGGLRFPPALKPIIESRFPGSRILLGELFPGKDGKLRYLETIRVGMFRKMLSWFHEVHPDLFVYLCMETDRVWRAACGWSPKSTKTLVRLFDERCRQFMKRHGSWRRSSEKHKRPWRVRVGPFLPGPE